MIKQLLLLMAGLALGNAGVAAEFDFERLPDRVVGSWAEAVVTGDVNGDGLDDVVLGTLDYFDPENDYHVFVFLQQPDGTLAQPAKYKYAETSYAVDLALGDLNNDGIKDIIVGSAGWPGSLVLLISDGLGGFASNSIAISETSEVAVEIMDINLDGNLDIIGQYWEGATMFFGDGAGGIGTQTPLATVSHGHNDLKIGDVTADGVPDIVLVSGSSSDILVYPHDGTAGFGPATPYPRPDPYSYSPDTVAIGDFDGDGLNDIAVNIPANTPDAAIWLYPGTATGRFSEPRRLDTHEVPKALVTSDLDGDGRDDLVVGHAGWSSIGRYMQGLAGLGEELLTGAPFNEGASALAVGDINDDGCADAIVAEHSAGLVTLQGRNCIRLPASSDFNGDGRSDVLWRHFASGANAVWLGADADQRLPANRVADLAWQVIGVGDFNGDGKSDLAWRNARTGAGSIWASANPATSLRMTTVTDLRWTVVGTGDFDGDGHDDLLWRHQTTGANAIWQAGAYSAQQNVTGVTNLDWKVVAVDDFNGDGYDDILWRNSVTGVNAIWRSGNYRQQQPVSTVSDPAWRVAGTGDFNTDGLADVLWHNASNGKNGLWYSARSQDAGTVRGVGPGWQVAAVGDYDGNGKPEILWRNQRTGENRLWRSTNIIVERNVVNAPDTRWHVMP